MSIRHSALACALTAVLGSLVPSWAQPVAPAASAAAAHALPQVAGAWIRGTVAGQQGTGAFLKITAREPMQLLGAHTPVAGVAEVHEMRLEGDVMRMRQVDKLDLPAGRTVELKPGGHHLMLLQLKQQLKPGTAVPLTLLLRDASGAERRLELQVPVATAGPAGGHMDPHKH